MQCTVTQLVEKFPDAQFVGGEVLLHSCSKNVVVGALKADEVVVLTADGAALFSTGAPAPQAKKAEKPAPKKAATPDLEL